MSALLDFIMQQPSLAQRLMSIMPMTGQSGVGGGGNAAYPYTQGTTLPSNSDLLVSRQGVTLQRGPMRSLVDIARRSDILPGIQEIGKINQGYRDYAGQVAAYRSSAPGMAAVPGTSLHGRGLAVDASWWTQHPELARAMADAGWNQFSPSTEPWHWSYGVTG